MKKLWQYTICGLTLMACSDENIIQLSCDHCTPQEKCCNGICTDIFNDPQSCGQCDYQCKSHESCNHGICTPQNNNSCTPKSCAELGVNCGSHDDGCGNTIDCGTCTDDNPCTPKTCAELNIQCGSHDDGCGNTIDCGTCTDDNPCTPKTCEQLGVQCGSHDDGCGNTIQCGTCTDDNPCTPKSCEQLGVQCGSHDDGCGNTIQCGTCMDNQTCSQGICVCTPKTCEQLGKNCGTVEDGCGNTIQCGTCPSGQNCQNNVCKAPSVRDIYPKRKSIKGLQPDFQDVNQVIGNETHGVAMNLVWDFWQPTQKTECSANEFKYDGYCFSPNNPNNANPLATANAIKTYSDAGVVVTAVIYGVPAWARRSCASGTVVTDWFCAPKDENAQDYGRFVGFLAHYFNGENGHGRIADFVIHNEVNASEWFNIGCTKGTCNVDTWTSVYADSWNAAYDYARKEQKQAKVLISFEHHFGTTYDSLLNNNRPVVSAQTFLTKLVPKLGNRDWRIAWHSYPPNLADPAFGANDWPRITFGNIGVIAGWIRQHYPNDPHAWEIQLTENGINGNGTSMQQRQRTQLCQAFENILGTPGIESFIYHRLIDIAEEGLNLGLWNADKSTKPAWETFALANRNLGNGWPACGFQHLPYIRMKRGSNASSMHWITTRQFPNGFNFERAWKILREPAENTKMVYECRVGGANGNHAMISTDPACEGQFNMGPMGYVYTQQVPGTSPIYRCYVNTNGSHFVSPDANCEGQKQESLIGYAIPE